MSRRGEQPLPGQHEAGIQRAAGLIQVGLRGLKQFDVLSPVIEEGDEKQRKHPHVAKNEQPDPGFPRHMLGRAGRFSCTTLP